MSPEVEKQNTKPERQFISKIFVPHSLGEVSSSLWLSPHFQEVLLLWPSGRSLRGMSEVLLLWQLNRSLLACGQGARLSWVSGLGRLVFVAALTLLAVKPISVATQPIQHRCDPSAAPLFRGCL